MDVLKNWRSGFVRRWHMNPDMAHVDDTTAAHQGRCVMLVLSLWPDCNRELIKAAGTHDAAEFVVGDLSRPFKQTGSPAVQAHAELENQQLFEMGFGCKLCSEDQARLKFVDYLDSYMMTKLRAPHALAGDGWPEARLGLIGQAGALGVKSAVMEMI